MSVLSSGTLAEKIRFTLMEDIGVYITLVQENVFENNPGRKDIEKFILETVVPRFNKLRGIISDFEEKEENKQV